MTGKPFYYNEDITRQYASHGIGPNEPDEIVHTWIKQELPRSLEGMTVYDVGCGTGRWMGYLQSCGAARYVGIDISREMLSKIPGGRQIVDLDTDVVVIRDGALLICGNVQDVLNHPEIVGRGHIAFASFSICHMDDPGSAITAMGVSLRRGGRALVSTNVFVPAAAAPTSDLPIRPADLSRAPIVQTADESGRKKESRVVLHLPSGDLPLKDKAHCESDYAVDPRLWDVIKAELLISQKVTYVDGADTEANARFYPGPIGNVASVVGTDATLTQLCLHLRKK